MEDMPQLIKMYLQTKSCKNTRRSYAAVIDQYLKLNNLFTSRGMIDYFHVMAIGRWNSPSTLHLKRACLSDFCNFLIKCGVIDHNPAKDVSVPKKVPNHYSPLTPAQYRKLTSPKNLEAKNARIAAYAILAIKHGLRRSELISLTPNSLDRQTRKLTVVTAKTGTIRIQIMSELSLAAFDVAMQNPYNTAGSLGRALKKYLAAHSIPLMISFHCFRATFATRLFDGGKSLAVISRTLGHTSPLTTMSYIQSLGRDVAHDVTDVA